MTEVNILDAYLHPQRALRAMAALPEMEQRLAALQGELTQLRADYSATLANAAAETEKHEREINQVARSEKLFRSRCAMMEKTTGQLKAENKELQQALDDERREAEEAIAEINRRLDATDAMRNSYERRISHLRHALADARARLSTQADFEAVNEMVDLAESNRTAVNLDSETAEEQTKAEKTVAKSKDDYNPNDWLMSLPE